MGLYDVIKNRKTMYSFSPKQVKEETIIDILDSARLAPAAGGVHEYEFVVITEPKKKEEISKICLTPNINSAPFIIVIICNPSKLRTIFDEEDSATFCIENAAIAIENILLFAAEQGLGSAWIATTQQEQMRSLLGIPNNYIIRGVIPIGYPSDAGAGIIQTSLPQLKEITHIESFNNKAV
ncbi:MAG: nitroreductase family protein [Candidatus Parvarchaeota archaeon]|nr:nitroreductase family protein [Candidatus Parvarchaeota archaeon]